MHLNIDVPDWFTEGMTFLAPSISERATCTVKSFDSTLNLLEVSIEYKGIVWIEDGWDLQHTLWGFERGDYSLIPENSTI